jgi:hypothetical protein
MDEITLLTAVRPDAPERLGEPERGELLSRLLAEAAGERAAGKQMAVAGRLRRAIWRWRLRTARRSWTWRLRTLTPSPAVRRLGIASAAAAATLATVAAVLFAFPATGHPPAPARTQRTVPAAVPAPGLGAQDLTARPGQFVYTEQFGEGASYYTGGQNGMHLVKAPPYLERMWLSANGRRGVVSTYRGLPDGKWGRLGPAESLCGGVEGHPGQQVCDPGYLTNLPGTVSGMRSYLLRNDGPNGPAAYRVLGSIVNNSSASGELVPNASYALMYRAALTVRGVYLVRHATTIAGTPGIAVAACVPAAINKGSMPGFRGCPARTELIFNASTYQLIGVDNMTAPGTPLQPGRPSSALLQIAVVNKIGQIP